MLMVAAVVSQKNVARTANYVTPNITWQSLRQCSKYAFSFATATPTGSTN